MAWKSFLLAKEMPPKSSLVKMKQFAHKKFPIGQLRGKHFLLVNRSQLSCSTMPIGQKTQRSCSKIPIGQKTQLSCSKINIGQKKSADLFQDSYWSKKSITGF